MAKEGKPEAYKEAGQPKPDRNEETIDRDELKDDELDQVSGGTGTMVTNLANMRHEMLKAVANNLRA